MNNNKGQSLIDVIFSIGIVVLVLTGIVVLVVSTTKVKRMAFERQKAVELSQILIEKQILEIKENMLNFWDGSKVSPPTIQGSIIDPGFDGYTCDIGYSSCDNQTCNIIFTIKWEGVGQSLSVERLFSRQGI